MLMPTVWLVFAYYFCLWFAVKTRTASWWKPWLGLGLFCGFVAMLVATILFAVPLLIVAVFRSVARDQPWPARGPKIAAAIATLVAGLYVGASPAWIHNYFIAHEPVMLSAHSGINFWIGNNPTATGYPKMPPGIRATQEGLLKDSITLAEAAAGRKLTRAEVSKFWSSQANAYISTHFSAWMRLMGVKFGNFWNAYQYDDLSIIKLLRDDGVLPPGLKFGLIAALGLAGLLPTLWRFPKSAWVVAAVFLHMCALLPVFVTERYRLAAVPGLMILGTAGLWIFWQNLAAAQWGARRALCRPLRRRRVVRLHPAQRHRPLVPRPLQGGSSARPPPASSSWNARTLPPPPVPSTAPSSISKPPTATFPTTPTSISPSATSGSTAPTNLPSTRPPRPPVSAWLGNTTGSP
ncbi:MAG: hypothetical protein WDN28_25500 [Chthoniobacter sp.]